MRVKCLSPLPVRAFSAVFPDARRASRPATQIVKPRPSHTASAYQVHILHVWRVKKERALHTDLIADAPDCERSPGPASPRAYHHALEDLRAGPIRLSNPDSDLNGIAGREGVYILILFELYKLMGFHCSSILESQGIGNRVETLYRHPPTRFKISSNLSGGVRVTIARIEVVAQSPKLDTIQKLASTMGYPVQALMMDGWADYTE